MWAPNPNDDPEVKQQENITAACNRSASLPVCNLRIIVSRYIQQGDRVRGPQRGFSEVLYVFKLDVYSLWFLVPGSCPSGQSCGTGRWVKKGHQSQVLMAKLKMIMLIILKIYYAESSRQWGIQIPGFPAETANRIDYIKSTAFLRGGGDDGSDLRNQASYPEPTTWIKEFCRSPGNEFFAEVPTRSEM